MSPRDFAEVVREMRKWQILYSKSGQCGDLEKVKRLEREVDRAAGEILWPSGQPGLFDGNPFDGKGGEG